MWVSASLWVSRPLCGPWISSTRPPLPNGLFLSLVCHPWAFMCQPCTSFILHGNLAPHRCLAPLAIILICWAFSKIICVGFLGLLGIIYHPYSNCERDPSYSICERDSSTHTPCWNQNASSKVQQWRKSRHAEMWKHAEREWTFWNLREWFSVY